MNLLLYRATRDTLLPPPKLFGGMRNIVHKISLPVLCSYGPVMKANHYNVLNECWFQESLFQKPHQYYYFQKMAWLFQATNYCQVGNQHRYWPNCRYSPVGFFRRWQGIWVGATSGRLVGTGATARFQWRQTQATWHQQAWRCVFAYLVNPRSQSGGKNSRQEGRYPKPLDQ